MERLRPGRRRSRVLSIAAVAVLVALSPTRPRGEPWSVDPRHPVMATRLPERASAPRLSASPFGLAFQLWSELLTRIDGPRCAHRPSCGHFARQALVRQGPLLGTWMALNRLMRGASSSILRTLPRVIAPGGVFFLDELADYRFWEPGYLPMSGR